MRTRFVVLLSLTIVAALLLGACTRRKDFERALLLERQGKYVQALESYKAQISTGSSDPKKTSELYFHSGECLIGLDRPSEAFSAYNKAVELDDRNQMAHLRLGELFLMAGSGERASVEASAALKNSGANLDALALLGAAAAANGQAEIARDAFTRVLTAEPGRVKVALSLADVYSQLGDVEMARETLKKASAAQPTSSQPWLALGRLEEQQGNIKTAEEAYKSAVNAENSPEANLRLAQFLERAARVSEAEQVLKRVDQLRPKLPVALPDFQFMSGRAPKASQAYLDALKDGRPASEIRDRAEAARVAESRARLISRLIEADLEAGRGRDREKADWWSGAAQVARIHFDQFHSELDKATQNLLEAEIAVAANDLPTASLKAQAAVDAAPESAPAHYVLGVVKYRSSDQPGARSEWDAAIEQDSKFVPARLALASYTLNAGDLQSAQDYIVPAVREEPGNFDVLMVFARVLVAQKHFASAGVITKRASLIDPTSAEPHLVNGWLALGQKNPGEALLEFQQAVLLEPRSNDAMKGLTRVYLSGKVKREMLVQMERTAEQEPRSATLLEIAGRLYAQIGFKQDAKRCLDRALQIDPSRQSAAGALAQLFVSDGQYSAATDSASRLRSVSPLIKGLRAQDAQDLNSAIESYETAVKAGDETGVAANNLAWIFAEQEKNLDRALTLARKAHDLAPQNPGVLDTLGYVYLKRREYTEAVSTLERAVDMAGRQGSDGEQVLGTIKRHLSEAYLRNGQTGQAASVAATVASLHSSNGPTSSAGASPERRRRY